MLRGSWIRISKPASLDQNPFFWTGTRIRKVERVGLVQLYAPSFAQDFELEASDADDGLHQDPRHPDTRRGPYRVARKLWRAITFRCFQENCFDEGEWPRTVFVVTSFASNFRECDDGMNPLELSSMLDSCG